MVQSVGTGVSRTGNLSPQEINRQQAIEAARRLAEEQAHRTSKARDTSQAHARQGSYQAASTAPLSAEEARLAEITAAYAAPAKATPSPVSPPARRTPSLDAARDRGTATIRDFQAQINDSLQRYPDASGDTPGKVAEIQQRAATEAQRLLDAAHEDAANLIAQAHAFAADKPPADRARILAEADARAAAIVSRAADSAKAIFDQSGKLLDEALKASHEYENKNWFEKTVSNIGKFLSNVWDKATDLFQGAVEAVTAAKDFADEQVSDFAKWLGAKAFKVVDDVLDDSPLGEDSEYTQEKTGILGDMVTNRLEVGESAFIQLDVDANIAGVQLGAGAILEIKRVPATDENGNPRYEPLDEHGRPPTELQVTLVVDANVGVGLSAAFGVGASSSRTSGTVLGNQVNLGAEVGASAAVEGGVQAQVEFTFTFDPNSQEDMDHLTGILGATAKASLPGIGILAAPDVVKAAADFGGHLTSVRGEVGAYATAEASVSARIGHIDEDSMGAGGEVRVLGTEGRSGQLAATGNRVIDEETNSPETKEKNPYGMAGNIAGKALSKLGLDLGELSAGVNGEVNVGAEHNYRSGVTTIYLNVKGGARASASALGDLGGGVSAESDRTIAIRVKDGEIQGIDVIESMSASEFRGIGDQDVRGRLNDAMLAQIEETDTITITRSYTPEALEQFKQQAGNNPTRAFGNLVQSLTRPDPNDKLEVTDIRATHTDELTFGASFLGTGFEVAVGRRLEQDIDTLPDRGQAAAAANPALSRG